MKLSTEHIRKLNTFCGYGDFNNAEVIFFGMEEGLGHWDVETNIIARCDYYGQDAAGWFNPSGRMHGYFERFGEETAEKMMQCLLDRGKADVVKQTIPNIQSLEFMSRLSLFLAEPHQPWFELKENQPELYKRITMYWRRHRLFRAEERIQTALFDWKPLPRASINDWPYRIENNLFNQKDYESAYKFKKNSNPFLKEMVQKRLDLLEHILSSEKFSTLVSFGDRPGKVKLLKNALSRVTNQPIHFKEVYLTESQKKISVAELVINNKKRLFICSPFFDSRALTRKGLEELSRYILPHFNNKENLS